MKFAHSFTLHCIIFYYFSLLNHNITHIINFTILISEIVQTLFTIIREFQIKIVKFKVFWAIISNFLKNDNMNSLSVLKFEKFSDSFMFSVSTDINKISYEISWLKKDAVIIINFFYWNDFLINLNTLIKLLEMIYNDVSQKYTVLIRFETCQQMNHEFINFYSEFLALMSELNWNKNMKIAALWKTIFNKIWNQLINKDMLLILVKFTVLC